jgi:AraC-like DNA-binding protein
MQASCSARILGPFLRLVSAREQHRDLVPEAFWSAQPDARVSLQAARAMLDRGAERLRDDELGLKLGRTMRFGEGGAFDYAMRSAPTLRESVEVAARYSILHSDYFRIQFEAWRSYAVIRLDDRSWSKPSSDFAMSAFYSIHPADEVPPASRLECWFPHPEPPDTSEYRRTFPGAVLRFGAPFFGFAFDRAYEQAPMIAADPRVHQLHRDRVDQQLASLREWHAVSSRVRRFIQEEIRNTRRTTVQGVARALRMTRRTLSRKLEQEGSSFTDELDQARRELALAFVADSDCQLKEAAFALGFAHVESFHRAFKRWTAQTPHEYRQRARLVSSR